jgi:sirohydrochlorin ferrochelatase
VTAVILLAHGSPDPRSVEATHALAATLESRTFGTTVRAAFLDHATPTLEELAVELSRAGFELAIVVPAFLSTAFHVRVDVPDAVLRAEEASGLHLEVAEPIGPDGALLAALDSDLPAGPAVLATAGTSDVDAQLALDRLARVWSDRRGAPVVVAYASQASPDVASAVSELEEATGARASVASFVLFPGILPDRIAAAAGGRALTPPLFSAMETVELIESRVRRALRRAA